VELADSLDSGSSAHYGRAGSSPASRTKVLKLKGFSLEFFLLHLIPCGGRELDFLEIRKQCYFLHFTNSLPNKNFPLVSLTPEYGYVSKKFQM
jgi:hypothetical protein